MPIIFQMMIILQHKVIAMLVSILASFVASNLVREIIIIRPILTRVPPVDFVL